MHYPHFGSATRMFEAKKHLRMRQRGAFASRSSGMASTLVRLANRRSFLRFPCRAESMR